MLRGAKGDTKAPANYFGIFLTPILSKVLERIVILQLEDQFSSVQQPPSDTQYGFRYHRSALHLLARQ